MPVDTQRVKPEDPLILTSGDSFTFCGPYAVRVIKLASLENGKVAVLIEVVDASKSDVVSGGPELGCRYWVVAKGRDESLAFLDSETVVSVHIVEAMKHASEVLPAKLEVQAWGEVRRVPTGTWVESQK